MNRTKMIYFLSAFVLIIGCFALNKSYSLFTQTIDDIDPIKSEVPVKDASLSISSIILGPGEEYLIKQTVTNKSIVPINYWLNTDQIENVKIAKHNSLENNKTYGISSESTSLAKESTKDIYLIVSNSEGTTNLTINFTLDYNYTTITPKEENKTNITNLEDVETQAGLPYSNKPNTLAYKIIENFSNTNLYTPSDSIPDSSNLNIISLLDNTDKITYPVKIETPLNVPSPTEFNNYEINEVGLYMAEDDYGTSYYYRGASSSNYVNFAGFIWRIVRINGDGSVRLILDGTLDKISACDDTSICSLTAFNSSYDDNAYVGYMYGLAGITTDKNRCLVLKEGTVTDNISIEGYKTQIDCENNGGKWVTTAYEATHTNVKDSTIKTQIDKFYETYIENEAKGYHYGEYLSDTLFCGDKSLTNISIGSNTALGYGKLTTYYGAIERLVYGSSGTPTNKATPTLKCSNTESLTEQQKSFSRYTVNQSSVTNGINNIIVNNDLKYPIALLSADEVVMAGGWYGVEKRRNTSYYLYGAIETYWWTMSPYNMNGRYAYEFHDYVVSTSSATNFVDNSNLDVRPVINLSPEVLWSSGNGSKGDGAYTVRLP